MKNEENKYSPAKLYVFQPNEDIDPNLVLELSDVIQIGVGGHVLEKMSLELQDQFIELEARVAA